MILKSIRWRLQVWHGLILVIVLNGFGFAAYQAARENQSRRVDQELEQRISMAFRPGPGPQDQRPDGPGRGPRREGPGEWRNNSFFRDRIRASLEQTGAFAETNSFYYVLWREDGSMEARSIAAPATVPVPFKPAEGLRTNQFRFGPGPNRPPPGRPANSIFRTRGEFREVYRPLPGGDCLLVGRSTAPELAAMRRFALWLAAAGTAILALGLAGGWWVAGRVLRPVEAISTTAAKISAGDLSQRINVADTESELGRLAGVLNATFSRLESAFAHQARFTSDASHELRTPISVILTQIQSALSREREPSDYREALQACERAAQRMRRLTDSLLELAKLDAGQHQINREPFDLARVAREAVDLVRPLAADRRIALECELVPVKCVGDANRIGQVATNLLTNAIRFNRDEGQVRVKVFAQGDSAVLSVTDTGVGIAAEHLPHIFDRFYTVDESRSRRDGSTGLGLAICKAIVDAHSGSIEVQSQPGYVSTFTVKLPAL